MDGRVWVYLGSATGLETSASWTIDGGQVAGEAALLGGSVASAGDVNGDGFDDVIVGAITYSNGQFYEGAAFLYLGSATGLATTPAWTAESDQQLALFGQVATAGDVNGDGYSDVLVGARSYDVTPFGNEGKVFLYLGSASGLATTPAWTLEGNQTSANSGLGSALATAGDTNGDGFDDVILGHSIYSNGETSEGRALVYLGSASGLAMTPAWAKEYNIENAFYGSAVGTAGDTNGDGFDDILVGSPGYPPYEGTAYGAGTAWLYLGSASGPRLIDDWEESGHGTTPYYGNSVATAGDVNGNGRDEFLVSSPEFSSTTVFGLGEAYLYSGICLFDPDLDGICSLQDNCPNFASLDQTDTDLDGVGDACDCAVDDDQLWLPPSGVQSLALSYERSTDTITLSWSPPSDPGGTGTLFYDVIRSEDLSDFGLISAVCIESDDALDSLATDSAALAPGGMSSYLVRTENVCGLGSLGTNSNNVARTARSCP